jgi:hypothetical protein
LEQEKTVKTMLNSQYILEKIDSFLTQSIPFSLHLLGGAAFDLVEDIIISKITRFDTKDRQDIRALMRSRNLNKNDIAYLMKEVDVPEVWKEAWELGLKEWGKWTI